MIYSLLLTYKSFRSVIYTTDLYLNRKLHIVQFLPTIAAFNSFRLHSSTKQTSSLFYWLLLYFPPLFFFFLTIHKSHLDISQLKLLKSKYRPALSKLRKLDISLASDILFPLCAHTGRPAIDPAVLVCSFVLMNHLKYSSIKLWCDDLANDSLLQYLIDSFDPPNSSSHYDFIICLTSYDPHLSDLASQSFITKKKI